MTFGAAQQIDLEIVRGCSAFLGRMPSLDALMQVLVENDLAKGGVFAAALWWFWHTPHTEQGRRREVVIAIVAGAIMAALVSRALCHFFPPRSRSFAIPGLDLPVPWYGSGDHSAFPSDHAALAFGLAAGFFALAGWLGLALSVYAGVFVCLPRLYLGYHWPSDLVAGALLGSAVASVFWVPRVRRLLAGPSLRFLSRAPGLFYAAMFLVMFELMTRFDSVRAFGSWFLRAFRAG